MYINRQFQVSKDDGSLTPQADVEFANLNGPKILLAAPGGGKTKACEEIAALLNGQFVHAEDLANGLFGNGPEFDDQILVIDGLDEVISDEIPKAFINILKTISALSFSNWLISCRAYEWRSSLFDPRIQKAFEVSARVAHIADLTDDEVVALLPTFDFNGDAEKFVRDAEENEASELLRNPQTLKMLSQAVQTSGWPKTKTELFLSASLVMAAEDNEIHQERDTTRPSAEQLLAVSGWVGAQLLISGCRGVSLGGKSTEVIPRPSDLASEQYPEHLITSACKTKLFRAVEGASVEPIHRTVAEFLAGRWLAAEFVANPRRMSPSRVLNYLTLGTGVVPPALRGLHAWITSLDQSTRTKNITKDPYGCLRYGDLSQFSDMEVVQLLNSLQNLAETDPFFRSQDWHTQFGRSLGRLSIKSDFVRIVSSSDTPYLLRCTLMDAIKGTELADAILDELSNIALNDNVSPIERHSAVDAMAGSAKTVGWYEFAASLLANGTVGSLRISLDQVISYNIDLFSGSEIAEHLLAYENAVYKNDGSHIGGIGFRISRKASDKQVMEIAQSIAESIPKEEKTIDNRQIHKGLEEWLLEFLPRVLSRDFETTAQELWPMLSSLSGHSYQKSEWEKLSQAWFSEHEDIRREIQTLAFSDAEDDRHGWMTFFRLSEISPGLHLRETDVIHHMQKLLEANDRPADWLERWKSLVRWAQINRDFDGSAIELARMHTEAFPELQLILNELLSPPSRDYEKEEKIRRAGADKKLQLRARERHASFSIERESMEQGKNLSALYDASRASLGHFSEFRKSETSREKIEEMVGTENYSSVVAGLNAAGGREDIPTVRACANLHTKENKHYYLETISLALCVQVVQDNRSLSELPKETLLCALSACRWGMHFSGNASEKLESKLEGILFADAEIKLSFVKDSIEPSLEKGEQHVSGLYRVTTEPLFSDIMPRLSIEWLTNFENASESAVWSLLKVAIRFGDVARLADLISVRLEEGIWPSDEHRKAWHAAAFAVDLERFFSDIDAFAKESNKHIWAFRSIISDRRNEEVFKLVLSINQIVFLIESFISHWPVADRPSDGSSGDSNPWNATDFLRHLITKLCDFNSEGAMKQLAKFAQSGEMGGYQDHTLHTLANAKRAFAETKHSTVSLTDVRNVLLSRRPTNVSDLQMLFLEEFKIYQSRIRTGQSDTFLTYWNGDDPHIENYCRDRLLDGLEQQMEPYGVRVHKEGAMANETRVDLLLTCDEFDLPVEIKRQWHAKIWTAACDQLEIYSENYRTDGTGVYLVLWHGNVRDKTIPKPVSGERPTTAKEMLLAININLPRAISSATKIVVLDVSKPIMPAKKLKTKVEGTK